MSQLMPQKGKQEIAFNTKVDVMIYGGSAGSGKSRLILLKAGYDGHRDPDYEAVLFRRNTGPLKAAGGLFSEAKKLFSPLRPKVREKDLEILFKNTGGGNLKFTHLEQVSDAEGNHQGLQYSAVMFDELTHFEQEQFLYLIGRLRSESTTDSYCMATTNPDMDSWVLKWVEWYLDDDGYFDESKLGIKRYFLIVDEAPVFADTEEELVKDYRELCYQPDPITGEEVYVPPLSFMFIGGTIFDNPALIRSNPKYLSALKAQSTVNRKRLLDGCWYARAEGSNYFQREWLHKIDTVPFGCVEARGWDLAASEPSDKNRKPDFTASVKMLKTRNGEYVIVGDYDERTKDPKTSVCGRFRKRSGERDNFIAAQGKLDGRDCTIVIPEDPAAGGKVAFREMSKFLLSEGLIVKKDPCASNLKKLKRFEPFSTAAQNGLISIVESTFPNRQTLDAFYKELEAFDGERSTADKKDDWADSIATVYNYLADKKSFKVSTLPEVNTRTMLSDMRSDF